MSLASFIQTHPQLASSAKLLYYGGSFNPWHEGHSTCVRLGSQIAPVIVMPDNNPQKGELTHRTLPDVIAQTISEIGANIYLYPDFYYSDHKTPTAYWLNEVKTCLPEKHHCLLLGHDSFVGLDSWIEYQSIINELYAIYVVSRLDDQHLRDLKKEKYLQINPKLEVVYLGNHPYEHLSSSQLRSSS